MTVRDAPIPSKADHRRTEDGHSLVPISDQIRAWGEERRKDGETDGVTPQGMP